MDLTKKLVNLGNDLEIDCDRDGDKLQKMSIQAS